MNDPNGVVDTRLTHQVHRRATDLLADAAARPGAPAGALDEMRGFLVAFLRHHHESEDHHLWPTLLAAEPQLDGPLADLTADHDRLDVVLDALGRADPADRDTLAAAAGTVRDQVQAHLEREEPVLLPALARSVDDAAWTAFSERVVASAPDAGAHLMVGLLDEVGTPDQVAMVLGTLPEPAQAMLPAMRAQARATLAALRG